MVREFGWDIIGNDGFRPSMINDVAGRVDFMLPALQTTTIPVEFGLGENASPAWIKASLTYVWFAPPPPEAQDRMQKGIIRRIEAATPEGKDRILNRDIPALMAAKNVMESTHPPVVMATAASRIRE